MSDVIPIDGPTSSGKNSVAHLFARKIGYMFLDSGSIYRAFALELIHKNVNHTNDQEIDIVLNEMKLSYRDEEEGRWFLDGVDITDHLHDPEVTKLTPDIAAKSFVREHATRIQRELCTKQNTVLVGRDIGTVIFPEAKLKFYLTAEVETRAKRRYDQFKKKGRDVKFEDVLKDLMERDFKDMTREVSPLKIPEDAVVIDTTHLTPEESVEKFMEVFSQKN